MARQVYVLGWYGHGNLGDEAFKQSFQELWPEIRFTFGDSVPSSDGYDALWVGGGSFMDQPMPNLMAWDKPLGFIGVGFNENVHPDYLEALGRAEIVVARNASAKLIAPRAHILPDLVFAQTLPERFHTHPEKRATILLNDFVSPRHGCSGWHWSAYNWFIHEFAKACDHLVEKGFLLDFVPMGFGKIDDRRVAAAVIGRMEHGHWREVRWYHEVSQQDPADLEFIVRRAIARSELVVTQRFHGIVFAAQARCPFVTISHHDKLRNLTKDLRDSACLNYYGLSLEEFQKAIQADPKFKEKIEAYLKRAQEEWLCMSASVEKRFFG